MNQYNRVGKNYSEMIQIDPIKKYVQRPTAVKFLGSLKGKLVLDVGCGDGEISRIISNKGATVVGFDSSSKQIDLAKSKSTSFPNITYFVSSPQSFSYSKKFDKALAVMVLCYSKDIIELQSFFDSIFSSLKNGGEFILIDLDKSLYVYEQDIFGRIQHKLSDGRVRMEFVVPGSKPFEVTYLGFNKNDLNICAKKAGFKSIVWKKAFISKEGKKAKSKEYWADFYKKSCWVFGIFKK